MRRPGTGLSFEIPKATFSIIHATSPEKNGQIPNLMLEFLTDCTIFKQFHRPQHILNY